MCRKLQRRAVRLKVTQHRLCVVYLFSSFCSSLYKTSGSICTKQRQCHTPVTLTLTKFQIFINVYHATEIKPDPLILVIICDVTRKHNFKLQKSAYTKRKINIYAICDVTFPLYRHVYNILYIYFILLYFKRNYTAVPTVSMMKNTKNVLKQKHCFLC